jgi:pantetheine-phosphate adenylyltransferase
MPRVAIYAGSYDPFTRGHLDVLKGGLKAFDHVIVGIGANTSKRSLFGFEERRDIITEYFDAELSRHDRPRVAVEIFEGLLIEFCSTVLNQHLVDNTIPDSVTILRGLRAVSDFEAEMAIADANRRLDDRFPTMFVPTAADLAFVSSSIAKEIAQHTNFFELTPRLDPYVIPSVAKRLHKQLHR